jgi:hypothetical protein
MSWSHELPQVIGHGLGHRRIVIASGAIFAVKYNLGVIARLDRAIQYSRDAPARIEKPRRTGFPAFAGMTAEGGHTFAFPRHHLPESCQTSPSQARRGRRECRMQAATMARLQ